MATIIVNRFDGGMTADLRDTTPGVHKTLKHFDLLTRPNTITPFRSQITGDSSASTQQMRDFLFYNSIVYGAGVDSGTSKITVHTKSDFTSATWGSNANNAGTSGTPVAGVFIEYKGYGYGFYNDGRVWRNGLGGAAWVDTATTIGSAASERGIAACVHSKDDSLYMAAANIVARNTMVVLGTDAWTNPALTLPDKYVITSMCEYGTFLAIACKPKYAGKSVVYLWDRNTSLTTVAEVIDFGFGNLQIIEQVEGELIGISVRLDILTGGTANKLIFRAYSGGVAIVFEELLLSAASSTTALMYGQKFNANRLYFLADVTIDIVVQNGIWAVGKNASGRWIVWFDRLPNNDTAVAAGGMRGFFMVGEFTFIAYEDSGYKLTQMSSTSTAYTGSSIVETVINPNIPTEHRTVIKEFQACAVSYESFPSGGQVTLKFKADGASSWTTIFVETTTGKITTEKRMVFEAREVQFRIESTGGVCITELKFKYAPISTTL